MRPDDRFWLALARSKGRTVRELKAVMTPSDFVDELAYHLYYDPLPHTWQQASLVATAALNPHLKRGQQLKPFEFVPVVKERRLKDTTEKDKKVAESIVQHLLTRKAAAAKRNGTGSNTSRQSFSKADL